MRIPIETKIDQLSHFLNITMNPPTTKAITIIVTKTKITTTPLYYILKSESHMTRFLVYYYFLFEATKAFASSINLAYRCGFTALSQEAIPDIS